MTHLRRFWSRHWKATLIAAAIVAAFAWGLVLGRFSAPPPSPHTQASETPTIAAPTLTISGSIIDATTQNPVVADVFVDDDLVQSDVTVFELVIPLVKEKLTQIRVEAPSYKPWELAFQGDIETSKRIEGPIRLVPESPAQPG